MYPYRDAFQTWEIERFNSNEENQMPASSLKIFEEWDFEIKNTDAFKVSNVLETNSFDVNIDSSSFKKMKDSQIIQYDFNESRRTSECSDGVIYQGFLHKFKYNSNKFDTKWCILNKKYFLFYRDELDYNSQVLINLKDIISVKILEPMRWVSYNTHVVIEHLNEDLNGRLSRLEPRTVRDQIMTMYRFEIKVKGDQSQIEWGTEGHQRLDEFLDTMLHNVIQSRFLSLDKIYKSCFEIDPESKSTSCLVTYPNDQQLLQNDEFEKRFGSDSGEGDLDEAENEQQESEYEFDEKIYDMVIFSLLTL